MTPRKMSQANTSIHEQDLQGATEERKIRAMYSPDGSAYKGTWLEALRDGYGTHVYPNGDVYEGEWKHNLPHGVGEQYIRDEKLDPKTKKQIPERPEDDLHLILTYDGEYEQGRRQGFGRFFYSPQQYYVGYWHKSLREGFGCLYYSPDNDRETILQTDCKQTQNVVKFENGKARLQNFSSPLPSLFIGEFSKGYRNGPGRVIYSNGDVFVGEFSQNAASGPGITYYVQRHCKTKGFYDEGCCTNSMSVYNLTDDDYTEIFSTWAHCCGGWAGLSLETFMTLEKRFGTHSEEFGAWEVDFRFYNDEHCYPYNLRPSGEFNPSDAQLENLVELAYLLPIKMAKRPDEVDELLNLPLREHGVLLERNALVDPMGVFMGEIQNEGHHIEASEISVQPTKSANQLVEQPENVQENDFLEVLQELEQSE